MSFRDDRDALLHRADALQRELDQAKDVREANEERVSALERELAAVRSERDQLREEARAHAGPADEAEPSVATSSRAPGIAIAFVVGMLVLGIVAFVLTRRADTETSKPRLDPEAIERSVKQDFERRERQRKEACARVCEKLKRCAGGSPAVAQSAGTCPLVCPLVPYLSSEHECIDNGPDNCDEVASCLD